MRSWGDAGWHRPDDWEEQTTPRMNEIVAEGVELDRHYAFKYCSPSRSAMQTGRHPIHVNVMNTDPSYVNWDDQVSGYAGIPRNMTGIAQVMKRGGYSTHMVGKWDVGMATPLHTPAGRGYDSSLSYFYHTNDYWNFTVDDDFGAGPQGCESLEEGESIYDLWVKEVDGDEGPAIGLNNSIDGCYAENGAFPEDDVEGNCMYEDALFQTRALKIVNDHDLSQPEHPLFLFYAPHIVHEPLQVPEDWLAKFDFMTDDDDDNNRQRYNAMVHFLDSAIGNVTDAVKARGMWDNTLIVFSADNGGPVYRNGTPGANNWPLKGGKAANWEGGIRVNAWAAGGFIPPAMNGKKLNGLVTLWDWYATFARLAGEDPTDLVAEEAGLPAIDSVDVWDYLSGAVDYSPRREMPVGAPSGWHDVWGGVKLNTSVVGIIYDDRNHTTGTGGLWKLLVNGESMAIWQGPKYPNATSAAGFGELGLSPEAIFEDCNEGCLYKLDEDPHEISDIADQYPDLLAELQAKSQAYNETVFSPDRGTAQTIACDAAQGPWANFWGPFLNSDGSIMFETTSEGHEVLHLPPVV
mmetsp:Transcript_100598/g.288277  ORF Transcript_100598/g.288277 Transcript_100598/m.288277 type:complete len:575 (-) Transcript_100598:574-2298(-)